MSARSRDEVIGQLTRRLGAGRPVEKATTAGLAAIGITVETVNADGTPAVVGTPGETTKGAT